MHVLKEPLKNGSLLPGDGSGGVLGWGETRKRAGKGHFLWDFE